MGKPCLRSTSLAEIVNLTEHYINFTICAMAIHDEVLRTARRLCRERGGWTFTAEEVVRALPDLNESSVRTHIVSRCCVDAPKNHPHKWDYFTRPRRGVYEIRPAYRRARGEVEAGRVAEAAPRYGPAPLRETLHVTVTRGEGAYVAECWEVAVVTQGRTLDEVVANVRDALALHLESEDLNALGLTRSPKLAVTYESSLQNAPETQAARG
jgi:predicted RNase H-like HicB family nuclease